MAEFDLTPKAYKDSQYIHILLKSFLITSFLIISTTVAANVIFKTRIDSVDKALNDLQLQKIGMDNKKQYLENLNNIKTELTKKIINHKSITKSFQPKIILTIIDQSLTDDIWFNQLMINNSLSNVDDLKTTGVIIEGETLNHSLIAEFTEELSNHSLVKSTDIKKTLMDNNSNIGLIKFTIAINIRNDHAQ